MRYTYDTALTKEATWQELAKQADTYTIALQGVATSGAYTAPESSICLPTDAVLFSQVQELVKEKVDSNLRYHLVVGIGGSNLGTKAVYDALYGQVDLLQPERFPKLLFAETTDPEWLERACALLKTVSSAEQVLVSVISKSGGTTETLANFEIIMAALTDKFGDCRQRVVAITDEGSALWQQASEQQIRCLAIPAPVGGRYSVLSAVGLFPLATIGVDIAALCKGAAAMREECLAGESSPARNSALWLAYCHRQGKTIHDTFLFHPELESLGKWYRQLMGESIGKKDSLDGQEVHIGITPTVSLGSTDLHSVGQLYLGGPKDKSTTFVYAGPSTSIAVPAKRVLPNLVPMITDKRASDIMDAILEGVKIAYQKADLPYLEVQLDAIDARSLGEYLQFKMIEMMYLGQLLRVNSFDQPSVEAYKVETKAILERATG